MPFLRLQTIALFAHTDFGLSGRRCRVLHEAAARTDVLFSMLTCSPPALGAPAAASAPCTHTADAFGRQHGTVCNFRYIYIIYMDCLLKRRQGCEDKKLPRQKQNRTKVHYSTHTKHIQRLTRHQDAGKREQKTDLRCQRDENLRRRSPPRRRGTGRVADERPQEAECCRPCGRQQPEHQQGRCARDAERKRIHDICKKMHRPYEYFTFRNDSVSRTLDLAKYVVGPYQKQTFSKKLGTEVRGRTPKSPQGIQKSHFWLLGASVTLCATHILPYTVQ